MAEYAKDDYLLPLILDSKKYINDSVLQTREYRNMIRYVWKRAMFHHIFGDVMSKKILDLGGGYCGVRKLIENPNYTLLERREVFGALPTKTVIGQIEHYLSDEEFDVVVCSDLLVSNFRDIKYLFDKFLPLCREFRFSLTFRFRHAQQYAGWTIDSMNTLLHDYCINQKRNTEFFPVEYISEYGLSNERNVYLISLKGDL